MHHDCRDDNGSAPADAPAAPPAGEELLRRRLLEILQAPLTPQLSYAEFLAGADEDTLAEWVDDILAPYAEQR